MFRTQRQLVPQYVLPAITPEFIRSKAARSPLRQPHCVVIAQ